MDSVFIYDNPSAYLIKYKLDKKLSWGQLADKLSIDRVRLFKILEKGICKLNYNECSLISDKLGHLPQEADYFNCIVEADRSRNKKIKDSWKEKAKLIKIRFESDTQNLTDDQKEYISKWYHSYIKSMISIYHIKDNYNKLAKKINPTIEIEDAKLSIDLLARIGIIIKDSNGYWQECNPNKTIKITNTNSKLTKNESINYHKLYSDLINSHYIKNHDVKKDYIRTMILQLPENKIDKTIKAINKFANELKKISSEEDNSDDCVYLYQISFYHATNDNIKMNQKK